MSEHAPASANSRTVPRRRKLALSPPQTLALTFALFALVGGVLLQLPGMTHAPITPLQAFFTATSATMVTGLTVVDTGSTFTWLGQCVIAVMMQAGGIGTMVFAALALLVSGGNPPLRVQMLVGESTGQTSLRDLRKLMRVALLLALAVEAIGALLLWWRLRADMAAADAIWAAAFHAVSAFNNAGFGLWPDNLVRYATDGIVIGAISALVIIGGLGFVVLADPRLLRGRAALHTRITLAATAVLLAGGTAAFWLIEAGNSTLAGHSAAEQGLLAWFMAVVPRTAGFNSVDVAAMTDAASLLTMALMFIGGGTGSTAGGVKVTTLVVLLVATIAVLRSREPRLWQRTLDAGVIMRAFAILATSVLLLFAGTWLLVLTQPLPFLDLCFEAMSAFATVGMTRGITDDLDASGQLIVMALMFVGRLGPLTLAFALATSSPSRIRYPKGEVYVG